MFMKKEDTILKNPMSGVRFRTIAHSDNTHLTEFFLEKGATIPMHNHPNEQTGFLLSGRMNFTIDGEFFEAFPGDGWCISGDVKHGVEVLEDSVVIEVFSPPREDYLNL
ncbi:cupin domain-containing protein [Acidobacteriota bacterium]